MAEFDVSMTKGILPCSLYIWGIFFAPIYLPFLSEKFGRNIPYFGATIGLAAFILSAAYSQTYTSLAVCRFFAGLCGGSNVVQIEGTFADVWPALYTGSYYSTLTCASYFGAATGEIFPFPKLAIRETNCWFPILRRNSWLAYHPVHGLAMDTILEPDDYPCLPPHRYWNAGDLPTTSGAHHSKEARTATQSSQGALRNHTLSDGQAHFV